MQICCISREKSHGLVKRLQALGAHLQVTGPEKIKALGARSTDLVYVVPYELLDAEGWPGWRVSLARGNRYYVVIGEGLDSSRIMKAARDGAYDVVDAGDPDDRLQEALANAGKSQALWWQLYGSAEEIGETLLVGRSSAMGTLRESIQRIGPTKAAVLILGESGTGKERVAEATQRAYGRGDMVVVNCAAIPNELMESELFGAEKGAYTGAVREKPGLVEGADGGTLFLDEIGETDLALQPKLLRFLENGTARRVGSTRDYRVDVRVISATNRDLRREAERGRFRQDLYYRLSEVILTVPPLRHRLDDIPDLAMLFMKEAAVRMGKNFEAMEPELIRKFQQYSWPGNVRELKQNLERLAIHYNGPILRADWWVLPEEGESVEESWSGSGFPGRGLRTHTGKTQSPFDGTRPGVQVGSAAAGGSPTQPGSNGPAGAGAAARSGPLNKREKMELARRLLEESDYDLTWTAAQLGVHPTTLYRWRKSGKV